MDKEFIDSVLETAGKLVLEKFNSIHTVSLKANQADIVTEVDVACEKYIREEIKKQFPRDTILGEEAGFVEGASPYAWVIDPIDGTTNFAAGLPWFGIMIGRLKDWHPVSAGIYLPVQNELYYAEKGQGSFVNNKKISVTTETQTEQVIVSYGLNYYEDQHLRERDLSITGELLKHCRAIRATVSSVDFCNVASGKIGADANFETGIWDNVAPYLLITEAGGIYTDIYGNELNFTVTKDTYRKNFTYLTGSPAIHKKYLEIIKPFI